MPDTPSHLEVEELLPGRFRWAWMDEDGIAIKYSDKLFDKKSECADAAREANPGYTVRRKKPDKPKRK